MDSVINLVQIDTAARFKKTSFQKPHEILMTASPIPTQRSSNQQAGERIADLRPLENVPQRPPIHLVVTEGQLQVHTAPYRGSFSVVLSEALRSAGLGSQVLVAQFLKGGVEQGPTGTVKLCGRLEWLRPNVSCCIGQQDTFSSQEIDNFSSQKKAVQEVWQSCKEHIFSKNLDQLVLDEIGLAVALGYLNEDDVISTLEQRPVAMDVILTGPSIPTRVMAMADQVTELRCYF